MRWICLFVLSLLASRVSHVRECPAWRSEHLRSRIEVVSRLYLRASASVAFSFGMPQAPSATGQLQPRLVMDASWTPRLIRRIVLCRCLPAAVAFRNRRRVRALPCFDFTEARGARPAVTRPPLSACRVPAVRGFVRALLFCCSARTLALRSRRHPWREGAGLLFGKLSGTATRSLLGERPSSSPSNW